MGKGVSRFLSTTALTPVPDLAPSSPGSSQTRSSGSMIENAVTSNGSAAIVKVTRHRAPELTDGIMPEVEMEQPEYITRHIEKRFLSSARAGYFQFGSLIGYRAKEGAIAGRLGDHQESRIHEIFNSRSGFFEHAIFEGLEIKNSWFSGIEKQVVVERVVNDFCSCSSIGEFTLERGQRLRDHETDRKRS